MLNVLKNRLEQGCKTSRYPRETVQLLPRYRGRPEIDPEAPPDVTAACAAACPQEAIDPIAKTIDMGRCVFCGTCERISKGRFVTFTQDFAISVAEKEHLITTGSIPALADHSRQHFKKLFGRSLQLRQVSAAGCNACEADLNVLATPFFDLARFGINFVASPRHADGIVVTGPISRNMKTALLRPTKPRPNPGWSSPWAAAPSPAVLFVAARKSPKGWTPCCRWTCSSLAARRIR